MTPRLNRRQFLGATAAGAALAGARLAFGEGAPAPADVWPELPPVRIYKVYVGRAGGIYMSRPKEEIGKLDAYLAGIEKRLGDVQFLGGDVVPPADVGKVLENLKAQADGVLMVHLSGHGGDAPHQPMDQIIEAGLQTVVLSQPFSGHGWMYFPAWRKAGKKVAILPTSDWSELDRIVALMRVAPRLRQTRLIEVGPPRGTEAACSAEQVQQRLGTTIVPVTNETIIELHKAVDPKAACSAEQVQQRLGTTIVPVTNAQILELHKAVDPKAAEAEAQDYWIRCARKIVEPTPEEIVNSARLYLAVKDLMVRERAQAITSSHCMGAPAKGCLTFSKLGDQGLVGACEGDIDSTLTMLMFKYAFGVPGFITDPVFDTSRNALIHFHCTSATKMDGPAGERLPFSMRTQTDSGRGVALEVENRVGQAVTCAKFIDLDTMLISTGKIIEVTHSPLACRTQFVTQVADARSMFHNWGGNVLKGGVMTLLHRAVFYGDRLEDIRRLADLMGFKVVEEA